MNIRRAAASDISGINELLRQVLDVHHKGRPDIFRAGAKKYNKFAADMDEETTEFWYGELYQMMLLAYLEMDQAERNEKVSVLKTMVNSK